MDVQEYLVTLGVGPVGFNALDRLPGAAKDRLTPLLPLSPGPTPESISKTVGWFELTYPSRQYFLDVESGHLSLNGSNGTGAEWRRFSRPPVDLDAWWSLLKDHPNASPCVLMAGQTIESARRQIAWARANGRTFCLRLNLADGIGAGMPAWMPELADDLAADGSNDHAIVFELGWVPDALMVEPVASGYINKYFRETPPDIPIAISCSSFPNNFAAFGGFEEVGFTNRDLIARVKRVTGNRRIVYGDWGTTMIQCGGYGKRPNGWIDYPTDNSWVIAGGQEEIPDFRAAASRIRDSGHWTGNLGVWGETQIEVTAEDQPLSIKTMEQMLTARVNIHLHRQAFHGNLPSPDSLDEEWID